MSETIARKMSTEDSTSQAKGAQHWSKIDEVVFPSLDHFAACVLVLMVKIRANIRTAPEKNKRRC